MIGINTAIIRGAQSICFAVAIDIASWVIPQLLQHGRVRRGYLGVAGQTAAIDRRVVLHHGLGQSHGVRVARSSGRARPRAPACARATSSSASTARRSTRSTRCIACWTRAGSSRDCALKFLRGHASPQAMFVTVRPSERIGHRSNPAADLQGLGQRPAHRVLPRLAPVGRRLGRAHDVLPRARLSGDRPRPPRPRPLQPGRRRATIWTITPTIWRRCCSTWI